ncbi:MAG: hypothetical protein ACI9TY_000333 [Alphaproteobacteria bacterium]|jgi:hypothetical protein
MNLYDVMVNKDGEVMLCIPDHDFTIDNAEVMVYPQHLEIWSEGRLQVKLGGIPVHIIKKAMDYKNILVGEFTRMSEIPSRQYMAKVTAQQSLT